MKKWPLAAFEILLPNKQIILKQSRDLTRKLKSTTKNRQPVDTFTRGPISLALADPKIIKSNILNESKQQNNI